MQEGKPLGRTVAGAGNAPPGGGAGDIHDHLADFTTTPRVLLLSLMAACIGALSAVVAFCLYRLIGLITNLGFYLHFSWSFRSPAGTPLGPWEVAVPVVGGLLVGVLARYGTEKIRGHGIPEAIEAILVRGSRIEPSVSVIKPVASAIAIGTGGPFGAEGPIIMTGGAFGSLIAQFFQLSAAERKTLLVAGAAAGMSATFSAPVSSVLIAVELLLFEWKPRSYIPVALAAAVAAVIRMPLLGSGPIFQVPPEVAQVSLLNGGLAVAAAVGVIAGLGSWLLTALVYGFEDLFRALPIHWMWWPAIGGLVIGLGGLVEPHALGVGYDTIRALVSGQMVGVALLGLFFVKMLIWSFSLGSGTSGGVLAPLMIMGASLGALEAHWIPFANPGFWAMVSMAAIMGGTMRAPFTAIVFILEVTHDVNALPALLVGCVTAALVTVLVLRRSILTEKVARRGHHLSREYSVDPLEILRAAEAMTRDVEAISGEASVADVVAFLRGSGQTAPGWRVHGGYPVIDNNQRVLGVITRADAYRWSAEGWEPGARLVDLLPKPVHVAYPDEPLSRVADRMAALSLGRIPVVRRADGALVGLISRTDLLDGRLRQLTEETDRRSLLSADVRVWVRGSQRPTAPEAKAKRTAGGIRRIEFGSLDTGTEGRGGGSGPGRDTDDLR